MNTKKLVFTALFAAILCILSPISVPAGPIPVTLSVFALFLTAPVLPPAEAFFAVLVYILLGALGLPVFSGFNGGFHVLRQDAARRIYYRLSLYGAYRKYLFKKGHSRPHWRNNRSAFALLYRRNAAIFRNQRKNIFSGCRGGCYPFYNSRYYKIGSGFTYRQAAQEGLCFFL